MRVKNLNNAAFTLLEVLLASIIFIISIAGIFATLNAVRAPVAQKENALAAAVVGQQVLNYLRSKVNTQEYYSGCPAADLDPNGNCRDLDLTLGPHLVPVPANSHGIIWPPASNLAILNPGGVNYTVNCADDGTPGPNPGTGTCSPTPANGGNGTGTHLDQARQVTLNIANSP